MSIISDVLFHIYLVRVAYFNKVLSWDIIIILNAEWGFPIRWLCASFPARAELFLQAREPNTHIIREVCGAKNLRVEEIEKASRGLFTAYSILAPKAVRWANRTWLISWPIRRWKSRQVVTSRVNENSCKSSRVTCICELHVCAHQLESLACLTKITPLVLNKLHPVFYCSAQMLTTVYLFSSGTPRCVRREWSR